MLLRRRRRLEKSSTQWLTPIIVADNAGATVVIAVVAVSAAVAGLCTFLRESVLIPSTTCCCHAYCSCGLGSGWNTETVFGHRVAAGMGPVKRRSFASQRLGQVRLSRPGSIKVSDFIRFKLPAKTARGKRGLSSSSSSVIGLVIGRRHLPTLLSLMKCCPFRAVSSTGL